MNSYVVDSPLTHVRRHVPGSVPGLCSVCKYLQGQARDNLQQSVTPAPGSAGPEPGPELATLTAACAAMVVMTLRSDCVQVTRISAQVSPPVCLSVLSSFTPDHHRLRLRDVLRVPRPGLA